MYKDRRVTQVASNKNTFMKISNDDWYKTINKNHDEIMQRLGAIEIQTTTTNGKVKLLDLKVKGTWAAILLIISILIWFFQNAVLR